MEQQIKQIAEELGIDALPCGYAFLNTTVAEVLFRGGHGMSGNTTHPVYRAELVLAMLQEILTLRQTLDEANDFCRSAYQIAGRNGSATDWPAFKKKLAESLERQHSVMYPLNSQQNGSVCTSLKEKS